MPEKIAGTVVVTGAAGFIGSQVAARVRPEHLILTDKLNLFRERGYNPTLLNTAKLVEADGPLFEELPRVQDLTWIIHMGAITNTAERDLRALQTWNVNYTKKLWTFCAQNKVNLVYASSAATYGDGTLGFKDDHGIINQLKPLNPYGQSKNEFDIWALEQARIGSAPPHWYGLKFFNVFGPNENHKGPMASSIWHGLNEILHRGQMTLFKSHNPAYKDGEQSRDFVFIDDVLQVIDFMIAKNPEHGIYNCGTGKAGTFLDVANALFEALERPQKINWIETPMQYREAYQYKTQADMSKLRKTGYSRAPAPLAEAIGKYLFRIGLKNEQ